MVQLSKVFFFNLATIYVAARSPAAAASWLTGPPAVAAVCGTAQSATDGVSTLIHKSCS